MQISMCVQLDAACIGFLITVKTVLSDHSKIDNSFTAMHKGIPPQMKILNMVIPILMHFCSLVSNWSVASHIKLNIIKQNVT